MFIAEGENVGDNIKKKPWSLQKSQFLFALVVKISDLVCWKFCCVS